MSAALAGVTIKEYIEKNDNEIITLNYNVTDKYTDEEYMIMFDLLVEEGIVKEGTYLDDRWVLMKNDGYRVSLSFTISIKPSINRQLKNYILVKLVLQRIEVTTAKSQLIAIKNEIYNTHLLDIEYVNSYRNSISKRKFKDLMAFKEFLLFIDTKEGKAFFSILDSIVVRNTHNSRQLPSYQSIILFDYIINDYIKNHNILEKAKYYPVLIWWKISSVIPLRPTEVYQLPKDCIYEKDDKFYIHIERIKKKFKRNLFVKPIINDFEIDKEIYYIIKDYIDYTNEFDDSNYLFSVNTLAKTANIKTKYDDVKRITTYSMRTIYYHFKKDIIEGVYNYRIVPKGEMKEENDIEVIQMGDIRHLTIINMMMMGYNPLYIMQMAGHQKLETQMGYYNHIETFATAKSHVLKQMIKKTRNVINISNYNAGDFIIKKAMLGSKFYTLPEVFGGKGRCNSSNFPSDCIYKDCVFCPHFIPNENMNNDYYKLLRADVDKDLETLKMELRLLFQDAIDNKEFELIGKQIGVTINKKILLDSFIIEGDNNYE